MGILDRELALPDEVRALKNAAAAFVERRILPHEVEIYRTGSVPEAIEQEMRDLGYYGLTTDAEYGGSGLSQLGFIAVHEELCRAPKPVWKQVNVGSGFAARVLKLFGTEQQRKKYLPGIAGGTIQPAIAVTEPEAGSDVQGLKTRAERIRHGWVLNGGKHYITYGARADLLFVLARSGSAAEKSKAFSVFLVEKGAPGLKVARLQETMGGRPLDQAELLFEDCEVAEDALLGDEGRGLKYILSMFAEERVTMGVSCLGTARRAIELAIGHAHTRKTFGSHLSEYQALQHMLANCAIEYTAARTMTYELARQIDQRSATPAEAAMVKVFCAEMVNRVVDTAVQIFGGAGYMAESPICQMYRDVRVLRIAGGASEIQRNLIAKELLR